MTRIAVIDNNVLANFFDIGRIDLLLLCRNIFEYILIPEKVKSEIGNYKNNNKLPVERERFISKLDTHHGFFRLCTTYDRITLMFLSTKKNIHQGEAEAIAQATKRNVNIFLTEDKDCIKFIDNQYNNLQHFDTLFLIALLDIQQYITLEEYKIALKQLKTKHGFNSKMLRISYTKAIRFLDIPLNKKIISNKTSF